MSLTILGIASSSPAHRIAQSDAADLATTFANATPGHERALAAIYRQTRIRSRGSVLLEAPGQAAFAQTFFPPADATRPGGPTTAERMARYEAEAGPLAIDAASEALARSPVGTADITHLVTCSCTGFSNPGVDIQIMRGIGLSPTVARTHVGFMGCHGGFNALRVAEAFAASDPATVVLVTCVELCSLHFQYGSRSDLVVANSIFADGAAALVGAGPGRAHVGRDGGWSLERQWSALLPDSLHDMGWSIGDHGFEMGLSARVPAVIGDHVRTIVDGALASAGLTAAEVGSWAVHPGGPRVLAAVQDALDLPATACDASRGVLADHGNMSSATIFFILERMLDHTTPSPCVALAFGPGLTVEMALFTRR